MITLDGNLPSERHTLLEISSQENCQRESLGESLENFSLSVNKFIRTLNCQQLATGAWRIYRNLRKIT